jgi:hypothetical protein
MKYAFLLVLLFVDAASAYERLQGPTELLFYDKDKAFHGYTLFGVGSRTYLLDMEGRVVHTWPIGTNPHLLDNGNILDASKDDPSGFQGFQEVDGDGKTVWEYVEKREGYAPHHDWVRIFNKKLNAPTTLYIANKSITHDQAVAAGADPKKGPYREGQMDAVVEVDMQGKLVWEWCFCDHVVQDVDPAKPHFVGAGKTVADHPGRININLPGRPLRRDWLHCNSMDYNAELGHVVINASFPRRVRSSFPRGRRLSRPCSSPPVMSRHTSANGTWAGSIRDSTGPTKATARPATAARTTKTIRIPSNSSA